MPSYFTSNLHRVQLTPTPTQPDATATGVALIVWSRCPRCYAGYFGSAVCQAQPCLACSAGVLQPITTWDLTSAAAPAGMVWR